MVVKISFVSGLWISLVLIMYFSTFFYSSSVIPHPVLNILSLMVILILICIQAIIWDFFVSMIATSFYKLSQNTLNITFSCAMCGSYSSLKLILDLIFCWSNHNIELFCWIFWSFFKRVILIKIYLFDKFLYYIFCLSWSWFNDLTWDKCLC